MPARPLMEIELFILTISIWGPPHVKLTVRFGPRKKIREFIWVVLVGNTLWSMFGLHHLWLPIFSPEALQMVPPAVLNDLGLVLRLVVFGIIAWGIVRLHGESLD